MSELKLGRFKNEVDRTHHQETYNKKQFNFFRQRLHGKKGLCSSREKKQRAVTLTELNHLTLGRLLLRARRIQNHPCGGWCKKGATQQRSANAQQNEQGSQQPEKVFLVFYI